MEISLIGKASAFGSDECRFESFISNINKISINYFYNRINIRNIYKYSYMFIKPTKYILILLNKFKYEGIICSFFFWKKDLLKVFFSYPGCLTTFKYIKFSFKSKIKTTISFTSMTYFLRNNFSIIYFSTSKGILSSEELFRFKCGGYVICTILS